MRRFICIVSAFTLLLAGCVKNEPLTSGRQEPKAEIAFESPIVAPKAKSVQEVLNYPADLNFKVWGFYSAGDYPEVDAMNSCILNPYMQGVTYAKAGDVWSVVGDEKYFWFHSGYLHFVAHAPAVPAGSLTSSTVTDEGLQLNGYTITDKADEDLMVSQVLYSQGRPKSDDYAAPLVFDHALSSIAFQVKSGIYGDRTSVDPERIDTDIRVVKIEVVNARARGDFSQQMTTWNNEQMDEAETEKGWTVAEDALVKTFTAYSKRGQILTDVYAPIHDIDPEDGFNLTNLMLLPQIVKDNVILRVTYDVTNSQMADINGKEAWVEDRTVEVQLNECGILEWLRGHRYCYNLTISLDKIECTTDVSQWDDVYDSVSNDD